ncbi:PTS glucose transporter subunit IIA [Kutzneria buriramensis]|uniref:Glucose-specific phosphotransferase system IIA component n=1 Tax=Kutzneria buriramensis TaxID=1045776 RepID=A0A3E0HG06_9PSEU|nr:PTS glucose transporter subunit IIA [Kutzneria buriramensis]REH44732.1 glucose-specific phosphotransferase system IIA component [Kutzneria buriramensis]
MTTRVLSPVKGVLAPITEVPDPVFAEAMVGPGVAVHPELTAGDAVSPVDGTIVTLHPHAFVVATAEGAAVLVHLGIDTVKLQGEGFTLHVAKGDAVRAGQPVIGWDPAAVQEGGKSPICPVVALDATAESLVDVREFGPVEAGDALFTWQR